MILDDLFEADLPAHIKKSDLPPGMRAPLTMRDVEAERPQGAFRFRVIPSQAGESPKEFMTLQSAQQHAQAVGGRVEPIREEAVTEQDVDVPGSMSVQNRGALILSALEQDRREFTRNSRRPIRFNMAGEQFLINDPTIKGQILTMAQQYHKKGALDQFLLNLGQPDSLHFLLNRLAGPSDLPVGGQKASPKAARYADESQDLKKKSDVTEVEAPKGAEARAQRMMSQLRARQPQAQSDLEALAYDIEDQRRRDQTEIDNLEREVDGLESDIKKELRQQVQQLRGRRGANVDVMRQIQARDQEQADAINKILKVNQDQQQAINDLERTSQREPARKTTAKGGAGPADATTQDQRPAAEPERQVKPAPKAEPAAAQPRPAATVLRIPTPAPRREIPQAPAIAGPQADRPRAKEKTDSATKKSNVVFPDFNFKKPGSQGEQEPDQPVAGQNNVISRDFSKVKPGTQFKLFPQEKSGRLVSNLEEKKKPVPTNPDLWGRAKSAARSKFDVYPSAYANAWAAKWYKSKGGGWRMGKPKKK